MKKPILFCKILCLFSFVFVYADDDSIEGDMSEPLLKEIALLETPLIYNPPNYQEAISLPKSEIKKRKSGNLAALLSLSVPGLGHAYLGEYKAAFGLFGSSAAMVGLAQAERLGDDFHDANGITLQNLGLYSSYAAYRDTRLYNGNQGYCYKMPTESLLDLSLAPFQWSVIKKPEVWGGFLGAFTVVAAVGYYLLEEEAELSLSASEDKKFPLLAFPVGIGEEAFFRGYLQSTFSEVLSPWGGILLSSGCFGALHLLNTIGMDGDERLKYCTVSLPIITSFGVYFGWLTYKNTSLKESVALHSWYDFTLFLLSYSVANSLAIGKPSFAFSFSF